ncbi:MAG: hypothetical protein OEM81_13020 [Acidimicrobiia bacterium]|nr:hypothetical protein [Acidimicrobiia bacterium]MDH3398733.1 hypothetical protein [Acidimicrobiia bacterium]MDH5616308.1 hypothetical protein [Acidimicrobiia bacterium]
MPRRSLVLGLAMVLAVVLAIPAAADPKFVDGTVDEVSEEIECGAETIWRDRQGWYGLIQNVDHVSKYHIRITYRNVDGDKWRYQDTGSLHWFDVDGEAHISLSGHSTNVGPDATGWYGRWVFNLDQETVVSLVGKGQGDIDQAACDALTN